MLQMRPVISFKTKGRHITSLDLCFLIFRMESQIRLAQDPANIYWELTLCQALYYF